MSTSIDGTYGAVVAALPEALRAPAGRLLFDVGMGRAPDARWEDVFRLVPSRDLPLLAVPSDAPCAGPTLAAFRAAHHCACFYTVLVDRLADQQAPATAERRSLAGHFLAHWRARLAEAEGDAAQAARAVELGVRAWRRGVALERAALARRALDLGRYGLGVRLKLGWAGLASEGLLRTRVDAPRLRLFRGAFFLLATAMQCVDDAEDSAEDEALHGLSLPAAVGFTPRAFFSAGALLTRSAEAVAAQGRFDAFAQWLSARADELEHLGRRRIGPADHLAAMVIASSLEASCLSMTARTPAGTAAITSCASST